MRAREREREGENESEREREREGENESERERERQTGANPPQRAFQKYENKNLTQKHYQGVILQNYENNFTKINRKLRIRHVIPENHLRKIIPRELFSQSFRVRV